MKILFVTGIFPPEIGGPATAIAEAAKQMKSQGHEVTVLTYGKSTEETAECLRVSRDGSLVQRYLAMRDQILLHLTPETLVVATDLASVGVPTRLALVGKPNRLVLRLGGEWLWEDAILHNDVQMSLRTFWSSPPRRLSFRLKRWMASWVLRRAQKIIVTSGLLGEMLPKIASPLQAQITVLQNVERVSSPVQRPSEEPHRPFRVIYVGRFAPVKNVPFFARVLRSLIDEGAQISCRFIGDGPDRSAIESTLQGVSGIEFLGSVAQPRVRELMADSDLLVLPSYTDISPNVVFEALGCNLPCLITSENGLPSGLGGVVLVSPTDAEEWKQQLRALLEPKAYAQLRDAMYVPDAKTSSSFAEEVLRV